MKYFVLPDYGSMPMFTETQFVVSEDFKEGGTKNA